MRAFFNILFFLIIVLCLTAPYVTGFVVEKRYESTIAKLNAGYGGELVFEGKFDRGYFSSHATTTITDHASDNVVLDHAIYHGPIVFKFEGWLKASNYKPRAIGLAVIETQILGKFGDMIAALYQDNPAYNITTTVAFNSDLKTQIINYPIKAINQNTNIEWQGFTADVNIYYETTNIDLDLNAPYGKYLELVGNDLSATRMLEITDAKITYSKKMQENNEKITMSIQNIKAVDDSSGTNINLDAISLSGDTNVANQIMHTDWKLAFNNLEFDTQKMGPFALELKMQNINMVAVNKFANVPLPIPVPGQNPMAMQAQLPQAEILELLSTRPILDLKFAFVIPLGDIIYMSHLEIGGPNLTKLDWEQIWAGAVLSKDLKISTPIVHKVLLKYAQEKFQNNAAIYQMMYSDSTTPNPYMLTEPQRKNLLANWVNNVLYALKKKKIIVEQDNYIIMNLEYKNDVLIINGATITQQDLNEIQPMLEMPIMSPPAPIEPTVVTPKVEEHDSTTMPLVPPVGQLPDNSTSKLNPSIDTVPEGMDPKMPSIVTEGS